MASHTSECIVCASEYFIVSNPNGSRGKSAKRKTFDTTNNNQKTWKTFIKYFFAPPGVSTNEWGSTIWDLIDITGNDKYSPFGMCSKCRQITEKLAHFEEQLEVIQAQVSKLVNTISSIIIHPEHSVYFDKDGNRRNTKRMRDGNVKYETAGAQNQMNVARILDERIAKRRGISLHQAISSRFNPQILHIPDWQNNGGNLANNGPSSSNRGGQGQLLNAAAAVGAAAYWQNSSILSSLAGNTVAAGGGGEQGSESQRHSTSYEKFVHNGKYPYERLGNEFKCGTCSVVKSSRQLLMTHLNYHRLLDTKHYACGTCGKAFGRKREVDRHERTHLSATLDKYNGAVTELGDGRYQYEGEWTFEGIYAHGHDRGSDDRSRAFIAYRCSACGVEKEKKSSMLSHLRWVHHLKNQQDANGRPVSSSNNPINMTPSSSSSTSLQQQQQQMHPIHPGLQGCNVPLGWPVSHPR